MTRVTPSSAGLPATLLWWYSAPNAMFTPAAVWTVGLIVLPPLRIRRLPRLTNLPRCLDLLAFFAAGEILIKASVTDEEILLQEIDLDAVETARTHWPFLRDRRIDAYADITRRVID